MTFIEWVQRRLVAHGYNPGVIDGVWGRNTLRAVIAFQVARNLSHDGRLDEDTVTKLRAVPAGSSGDGDAPGKLLPEEFPWMQIALRKKGLLEGKDNAELRKFLKSDGKTLGDPAKLPWCGDFWETCTALALPREVMPTNPYLARNCLKFGVDTTPCYGATLVFWRGSKTGTSGHVGFYYAEDARYYHVLGGNQSNSVSVARIAKTRLLGARLPLTGGPYRRMKVRVSAKGAVSTNEA